MRTWIRFTKLLSAALVLQLGQPAGTLQQLVPGVTLVRSITDLKDDSYPVRLAAGDFLRVIVDQEAVDLAVMVIRSDGTQAALVDGPGPESDYGTEDLAWIADAAGLYQIVVRAGMKNPPQPRYRIRMEAPRPAGQQDRQLVEAVQANQEATDGMAAQPPLPFARQAELRETARRIFHDLGESHREAEALLQLGLVRANLDPTGEAAVLLGQAAELYAKAGDPVGQGRVLNEAARLAERLGHGEDALYGYQKAQSLAADAGARSLQVDALNNLGRLLNGQGQPRRAIELLAEALTLSEGLSCDDCQSSILVNLGSAHDSLSETQMAIDFYKKALRGKSIKPENSAPAYNNLGLAYQSLGNPDEALASFQQANALHRNPTTLCNQGLALEGLERFDEALAAYQGALDLAGKQADVRVQASALHNIGNLYFRRKQRDAALASWDEVVKLAANRKDLEPLLLVTQADAKRERGDLAGAETDLERSLSLAGERGDRSWAAVSALHLAGVERRRGHPEAAIAHFRSAVGTIESLRNEVVSPELRTLFLGSRQKYYEQYVDALMELHGREPEKDWDVQALQVNEGARARGLLDLLGEFRADLRKGVDPALLAREADLHAEVNARDQERGELIHQAASPDELARAAARLDDAERRFKDLEADLRQSSPAYAALTQPQPLNAAAIQHEVLADGALLLEYALGDERSYLWAVSPTGVRSFTLPPREDIEEAARDYYEKIIQKDGDRASLDAAAGKLSRIILLPVESLLGNQTLLVVADGLLQYVPFAALPLPSTPADRLIASNRIVSLPSASTLAVLRRELDGRPVPPKTLAVLADPLFRKPGPRMPKALHPTLAQAAGGLPHGPGRRGETPPDLFDVPSLPFSKEEATKIAEMVADQSQKLVALGPAASLDTVRHGRLDDYRYVHLATHGVLDSLHPGLSRLLLAQVDSRGQPQDGSLRLQDIYNLQLNADLVVLSACETALGKEVRGEGLIGLTRGFMYAGSARVLASLWRVQDRATAKLMTKLYRHLLVDKLSPAESLRRAQVEMAEDPRWTSPYNWAGFSLQGEWK